MPIRHNNLKSVLFITALLICSINTTVSAGEHILIPKIGIIDWNDNSNHKVDNSTFDFDDKEVVSPGLSYLYKFNNGYSVGGEIYSYEKDIITTTNNSGNSNITQAYGIAEKFFNNDGAIKPFIGVGLGFASIKFDANINGEIADDYDDYATYLSYEFFAGVEFQFNERIGLMLEYKYFDLDIDDNISRKNINVKSNGDAFFVGVSIHL